MNLSDLSTRSRQQLHCISCNNLQLPSTHACGSQQSGCMPCHDTCIRYCWNCFNGSLTFCVILIIHSSNEVERGFSVLLPAYARINQHNASEGKLQIDAIQTCTASPLLQWPPHRPGLSLSVPHSSRWHATHCTGSQSWSLVPAFASGMLMVTPLSR